MRRQGMQPKTGQLPRLGASALVSLVASVAVVLGLGITPPVTLADFCGGTMTITPSHGAVGTTFRIVFSVGGPTLVHFYHRGVEVRSVPKPDGNIRMRFVAREGDQGRWRVRAAYVNHPTCYAQDTFRVDGEVTGPRPSPMATPTTPLATEPATQAPPTPATPTESPPATPAPTHSEDPAAVALGSQAIPSVAPPAAPGTSGASGIIDQRAVLIAVLAIALLGVGSVALARTLRKRRQ